MVSHMLLLATLSSIVHKIKYLDPYHWKHISFNFLLYISEIHISLIGNSGYTFINKKKEERNKAQKHFLKKKMKVQCMDDVPTKTKVGKWGY